jgi:hypothetical protein
VTQGVVIHLTAVPTGTAVRRRPGRPRKVHPAVLDESAYHEAVADLRDRHVARAPLVDGEPSTAEALDAVVREVASETAALGWEARRAVREGRDAAQTSSRRVDGLSKLAALVLLREQARQQSGDIPAPLLATLQEMFLAELAELAAETLPDGGSVFIARLTKAIASTAR